MADLMRAVVVRAHGGRDVLGVEEVPVPRPGPGEVLVRVHAVSVNRTLDIRVREGDYAGALPELPAILGVDPSGIVVEVGVGVERLKPGDRVTDGAGPRRGGGYAEYAVMPQRVPLVPEGLSFADATVAARHFPTAYSELRRADVKEGEWVLVMGAAGALGSCAIQVAKRCGARVIAAASTDERLEATMRLGADAGVNYRRQEMPKAVAAITDDHGADVVLENVADPMLWPQAFDSMARNGRLVTVGAHGGGTVPLNVERLYLQRLAVLHGMGGGKEGDVEEALALTEAGTYRTLIARVLPLAQVGEAHRLVEENEVLGKVLLDPTA